MNKKILGIICMMLLLTSAIAVQSALKSGGKIDVSIVSQEPDPALPGEVIDARFKVENTGFSEITDIYFEIIERYPFSVYSGEAEQKISSLQGLQKDSSGLILLYKLKVDENAVEGTNYIDARYKIGQSGNWITIEDIPIRVRTRDLVLALESIQTTPKLVSPGNDFELALTIRNNADSLIRDVKVNLDISSDDTPFAPSQSTGERQISQINAKTAKIMKFDLVALPNADGGIYKIPITLTYTDESGTSYTKEDYISLKVSSTPDLLVTIDSTEIKGSVKSGNLVIKITNRGLTDIKLVSTKLEEDEGYEITSEPEVYVGNIDSDDYETVEYELNVKSYDKIIELPLEINYLDATNVKLKETITLELKTYSPGLIMTIVSGIINATIRLAILAGIIYGAYWFYKKRKNKKRQG